MIIKYAKMQVIEVREQFPTRNLHPRMERRIASIDPIRLDPDRYLYIRNRSISALERHGPNDNGDGFPREELKKSYLTFVGSRVSLDHNEHLRIGMVIDSCWIPWQEDVQEGDYVENILALDKKTSEQVAPGLVQAIIDRRISDTSMGVYVDYSICSVCGNKAYTEGDFCDHIRYSKGQRIRTASGNEHSVYEINYGLTFFEDSVIVPFGLNLGGYMASAGGAGADPRAKILEKVATTNLDPYITTPQRLLVSRESSFSRASRVMDKIWESCSGMEGFWGVSISDDDVVEVYATPSQTRKISRRFGSVVKGVPVRYVKISNLLLVGASNMPALPEDQKATPGYVSVDPVGVEKSPLPLGDFRSDSPGDSGKRQDDRGQDQKNHRSHTPLEKILKSLGGVSPEVMRRLAQVEEEDEDYQRAFRYIMQLVGEGVDFPVAVEEAKEIFYLNGQSFPEFSELDSLNPGDVVDVDGVPVVVREVNPATGELVVQESNAHKTLLVGAGSKVLKYRNGSYAHSYANGSGEVLALMRKYGPRKEDKEDVLED